MTAPTSPLFLAPRRALHRLRAATRREQAAATDPQALARLLAMLASRLSAEIAGLVVPPVLIWVYSREHSPLRLLVWAGVYWSLCGVALWSRYRFRVDVQRLPPSRLTALWLPRFRAIALAFGSTWGALAWITWGASSHEFATLVYLVLSAAVASTAVLAAPVFSVFLIFFVACWGSSTAAVAVMFPQQWPWVLPLQLLYGLLILRHAGTTHHFVVGQLRLEAQAAQLARDNQLARDEAQRALLARSELLMRASHDLRQPVHALGMIADVLVRRSIDPQQAAPLNDLKTCVRTLQVMFESVMELMQLQAGKIEPHPVRCALRPLLEELEAQFRAEAQQRRLRWRVRLPAPGAVVLADPVLLRRALFNLVQNAFRYTRQGGVLVGLRRRGDRWRIEVLDTGVGVAEADHDHIYAPFFRHADGQRLDGSGQGLGLAVFAECVEHLGATSGLNSQPGRGSCFWLTLPAAAAGIAPVPAAAPPPAEAEPTATFDEHDHGFEDVAWRGCCLVVEADPSRASNWHLLLADWRIELRLASSPKQALQYLADGCRPAAIFCSLGPTAGPGNGLALLRTLMAACPDAAGALIGDETQAQGLSDAEELGYWVLRRPVPTETLHALLTLWLATPAAASEPSWSGAPHAAA